MISINLKPKKENLESKLFFPKLAKIGRNFVLGTALLTGFVSNALGYNLSGQYLSAEDGLTPASGIKVTAITGADSVSTVTDANGNWSLYGVNGVEGAPIEMPKTNFRANVYSNPSSHPGIQLNVPEQALTVVNIYDITGRRVSQLENNVLNAGVHRIEVKDALPGGVYIANIQCGKDVKNVKLNVLKGYNPPSMSGYSSSNISNNVIHKSPSSDSKSLTILKFEENGSFHAYIDSSVAISSDSVINIMAFPRRNMDYAFYVPGLGDVVTELDYLKYQWRTDLVADRTLTKPLFDAKIWLDSLSAPSGWLEQARGAVTAWNDSLKGPANMFQEVPSAYIGSDVSSIKIRYCNNDTTNPLGSQDGTVNVDEYTPDGRPLRWTLYVNTSHGMTDDEKKWIVAHELDRIIHHYARDSPIEEHIINMNTKPFTGISNDDVEIAKCVRNMTPNIRIDNYKK